MTDKFDGYSNLYTKINAAKDAITHNYNDQQLLQHSINKHVEEFEHLLQNKTIFIVLFFYPDFHLNFDDRKKIL